MKHVDMNKVYKQHGEVVYRFLLRLCADAYLAEDLMQDTFVKAIEKIHTFDNRCKISTWLCQIAKNTYYDNLRKEQRYRPSELSEQLAADSGTSLEESMIERITAQEIRLSIHQLPEPYKEVFMLRFYAELPFREIGSIFGKSEVWARVTYMRSRDMILSMNPDV